ncbi:CBP80 [Auxenochlorella protothecoides x Auxenochlorella symbiontica]
MASKRQREEITIPHHEPVLEELVYLGDDAFPTLELERDVMLSAVKRIGRALHDKGNSPVDAFLDCVLSLSCKIPLYSLIVGLLNVDDEPFVSTLLEKVGHRLAQSLASGAESSKGRILLQFLASLCNVNVVDTGSFLAFILEQMQQVTSVAEQRKDDAPEEWQPHLDSLVYSYLVALPFVEEGAPSHFGDQLQAILRVCRDYLGLRRLPGKSLHPFLMALSEEDTISQSDMGRASFIPDLTEALDQIISLGAFDISSIPRLHAKYEIDLANGKIRSLPDIAVPLDGGNSYPSGASPSVRAALQLEKYPPRRTLQLLDKQHTDGERPALERIIVEDYVLDVLMAFEGDRIECARRLVQGLPITFPYEPLLCQVLFGQMLGLPHSKFRPVMYATLMVDLCKLCKTFPRAMSACVRECFARMNTMDMNLRFRLAEWLAYHLSCFEYVWPWSKWEHVLTKPEHDGQRQFCGLVLDKLVRLSYWERIHSVVPPQFQVLLPPKPVPAKIEYEENELAAEILQKVRAKTSAEDLDVWLESISETSELSAFDLCNLLVRVILDAGSKSYTHMLTLLERYTGPLVVRVTALGRQSEMSLIDGVMEVWKEAPQRVVMAVDRLMTLRLVSAEAVISWIFHRNPFKAANDSLSFATVWEVLHCALDKTVARVQDAKEDLVGHNLDIEGLSLLEEKNLSNIKDVPEDLLAYVKETLAHQEAAFVLLLTSFAVEWSPSYTSVEEHVAKYTDSDEDAHIVFQYNCLVALLREYNTQFAMISGLAADKLKELEAPGLLEAIKKYLLL